MDRDYHKSLCLSVVENSEDYEKKQIYNSVEVMIKNIINIIQTETYG